MRIITSTRYVDGEPTLNRSHPLCQSLKGCWTFPRGSYRPRNLVTGIHLTPGGAPTWELGRGFYNDKSTAAGGSNWFYESAPVSTKTNDFTMSIWYCPDSTASGLNSYGLFANGNGEGSGGITLARKGDGGGGNTEFVVLINGVAWVNSGLTYTIGTWHNFVVVRRSSTLYMYVNGVKSATTSASNPGTPTTSTAIASTGTAGSRCAVGNFDLPMIWDRPLSHDEILSLWTNPYQIFAPSRLILANAAAAATGYGPLVGRSRLLLTNNVRTHLIAS